MSILDIIRSFLPDRITPVWKEFAAQRSAEITVGADILITYPWEAYVFHIEDRMDYIAGTSRQLHFSIARTEIMSPSDFSLLITREGILPAMAKLFGKKEIRIGSTDFDRAFYIRTNNEAIARGILHSSSIQHLLLQSNAVRLQIGHQPGYFEEKPQKGNVMIYVALDCELAKARQLEKFEQLLKELVTATVAQI